MLKPNALLRKKRTRSRDSVNFRREPLIDKLISMLSEPSVPLKRMSVSRDNVKPEKLLTALKSSRTSKSPDSGNSRIRNLDWPTRLPLPELNS